MTVFQTNW